MALLDFEHFARETNLALSNWFNLSSGTVTISSDNSGPYGYGRYANTGNGNSRGRMAAFAAVSEVYVNFHLWLTQYGLSNLLMLYDASTVQVTFRTNNAGQIVITRGGSTVLYEAGIPLSLNAWHFVQLRFVIAGGTSGSAEVRINGKTVATVTGVNTQQTANPTVNGWGFSGNDARLTNFIFYSAAGSEPNTWTPETRIYADLPTANGANNQWTRNGGSANYDRVNEQPNNGDTSYNSAGSAALDDLYAFASSIPGGSIIYGVASEIVARKDDAGVNDVECLIRSGGTTYADGVSKALSTSYQRFRYVWTTDPATGLAWTVTNANAAQVGIRRTA